MDAIQTLLLIAGMLLFLGVVASGLSARLGLPLLLVFLALGMAAGVDGPGGIRFDDLRSTFLVGNLALAVILLDGGLRTRYSTFRAGLRPALTLATVGVLLSAGVIALFAVYALGMDWRHGLLLGAIVGSTDAAAVFSLLRQGGTHLNERVSSTLEIESGANDPMAVFLVLVTVGWIANAQNPDAVDLALGFVQQFGIGSVAGILGGLVLAHLLQRLRLAEGLYALLIASGGLMLFAAVNRIGGSGFLAIYLCGLVIGNRRHPALQPLLTVMDGMAWLAQAGMFLLLGLLVTPSALIKDLPQALAVAAVLMLLARPLSVVLCLRPFRFPWRETGFISWVGLRGAVPIVLAVFPAMAGLAAAPLLFNIAFVVVLTSLLIQGSSLAFGARRLKVEVPAPDQVLQTHALDLPLAQATEIVTVQVETGAPVVGRAINAATPPFRVGAGEQAQLLAIARAQQLLIPPPGATWQVGDGAVYALAMEDSSALLSAFSTRAAEGPLAPRRFYGPFALNAQANAGTTLGMYGISLPEKDAGLSLAALMESRLGRKLVVGDRIQIGAITLVAQELDHGTLTRIGLKLRSGEAAR